MDILVGKYFIENKILKYCSDNNNCYDPSVYQLYEVMRVMKGKVVFLEKHLKRLKNGINSLGICPDELNTLLKDMFSELINKNANAEGNIKLLCTSHESQLKFAAYYVSHNYPSGEIYKNGARLVLYKISRSDPNLKQVSISYEIGASIEQLLADRSIVEVLLVNEQGVITEGSKSNFFLIQDGKLYTAPDNLILKGITRQYVIQIAKREGIECVFREILPRELQDFQAAFICGTSPKILPVREIDQYEFDENDETMRFLMQQYDKEILNYISPVK